MLVVIIGGQDSLKIVGHKLVNEKIMVRMANLTNRPNITHKFTSARLTFFKAVARSIDETRLVTHGLLK